VADLIVRTSIPINVEHFVVDPPWPKHKGGLRAVRPRQGRDLDYKVMSVGEIFQLLDSEILPMALGSHNVFLWVVDEFLMEAELEMEKRSYRRHARLIWDKGNGVAPCFTVRFSHEYLLWFYKPRLLGVCSEARGRFTTVIRAPSREHSRKPDEAYALLDTLYPGSPKIDVFSREARSGWYQYGDEVTRW